MILAMTLMTALQSGQVPRVAKPLSPRTPPGTWIADTDYPMASVARKEFGVVVFRLDVDVTGEVIACRILISSGFWALDQRSCELLRKRAAFRPARDSAGTPIPATFKSRFLWILPQSSRDYMRLAQEVQRPFELTISLNRVPAAYRQPALVRVRFGDHGAVVECSLETTSGSDALDKLGCEQARRDVSKPPYRAGLVTQPDTRMVNVGFAADFKPG
jgi:TonB family protein